jgi:MFS family permease
MFAMVNFLETPIVHGVFGDELSQYISLAEFGLGAFVALIAGRFADSVGRKRVIMVGFTMLGIGYAALTAFQDMPLFQYLYIILDGVAWGIFLPMFFLVVWSDLAAYRIKEKFYVIGLVPFLIASYSLIIIRPFAADINDASLAFTLASFFIFVALLPLSSAPETMPEKNIELKRLKKFANEAKKMKEKFENIN